MSLARHAAKILEQTPLHEAVAADMDRYYKSALAKTIDDGNIDIANEE